MHLTLQISPGGVQLRDHADGSVHSFAHLLQAVSYIEQVVRGREQALARGGLL